jgi:flagellin
MGLRINQNIAAMNAYRNLSVTDGQMSKQLEKLSSGYRINRAADDAAGLAISEGLRSQTGGLKVAVRNAQDGISVVQTAEGALAETHSILQRMRDLAVQSASDTNDTTSRNAIDSEAQALNSELTRIASKTTFNNVPLLDGTFTSKSIQVGYSSSDSIALNIVSTGTESATSTWANGATLVSGSGNATFTQSGSVVTVALTTGATNNATTVAAALNADGGFASLYTAKVTTAGGLEVKAKNASNTAAITAGGVLAAAGTNTAVVAGSGGFNATDLGTSGVALTTQAGALSAITAIDGAISKVSTSRASLGSLQNRFEHTINNLSVAVENLSASESRIRDTDMAQEMVGFTRAQILSQAGTSMLAQANTAPQSVLSLLRG